MLPRLIRLSRDLQPGVLGVLVNSFSSLSLLRTFTESGAPRPSVFVKVDTVGTDSGGLEVDDETLVRLAESVMYLESQGICRLAGLFSYSGNNYRGRTFEQALNTMTSELAGLLFAAQGILRSPLNQEPLRPLTLSFGSTPAALSIQDPAYLTSTAEHSVPVQNFFRTLGLCRQMPNLTLELHASSYVLMDTFHRSTGAGSHWLSVPACAAAEAQPSLDYDLALTILTEVAEVLPRREPPHVILAAGTLGQKQLAKPSPLWTGAACVECVVSNEKVDLNYSGWAVTQVNEQYAALRRFYDLPWPTIDPYDWLRTRPSQVPWVIRDDDEDADVSAQSVLGADVGALAAGIGPVEEQPQKAGLERAEDGTYIKAEPSSGEASMPDAPENPTGRNSSPTSKATESVDIAIELPPGPPLEPLAPAETAFRHQLARKCNAAAEKRERLGLPHLVIVPPQVLPWEVGDKVRLWPHDARRTMAAFERYIIVDGGSHEGLFVVDI